MLLARVNYLRPAAAAAAAAAAAETHHNRLHNCLNLLHTHECRTCSEVSQKESSIRNSGHSSLTRPPSEKRKKRKT
ncbi:hypothetical protein OUZ56_028539 [Daphnia magna]|uniref:Secreted protein n=1 Tax=Daphnia magna TaxID=35525 RepID=A0ABR0B461_9CRUS|nr:hypothetical protein OUZ56_028539 [Daphnia magna]